MNRPTQNFDRLKELLGNRRAKAIFVAVLILLVIVVLQVNNLNNRKPMCELLSDCTLRSIDLHRIQIALCKAGLTEFKLTADGIQVPEARHAEYLQAIAEHDAIPPDLRSNDNPASVANPFLSRTQQISIEREAKKRQIQQMVGRLPFVDQAWFEMDVPESQSAFQSVQKSAVISIRPVSDSPLMDQNIDTVRQMIGGAIAGIDPNQIVVIDLNTGSAHSHTTDRSVFDNAIVAQRAAFERQQLLEKRIQNALQKYPGLTVTVVVEECMKPDQVTQTTETSGQTAGRWVPKVISAGANGQASIADIAASESEIQLATAIVPVPDVATQRAGRHRVSVFVEVPCELITKIYGESDHDRSATTRSDVYKDIPIENQTRKYFNHLKLDLTRIIRPIVDADKDFEAAELSFRLAEPVNQPPVWAEKMKAFANENWPSIAVLLIGLMLISLITQTEKPFRESQPPQPADIISMDAKPITNSADRQKRDAEVRLSRLIEKDPDAAAKVIESWIRDAA